MKKSNRARKAKDKWHKNKEQHFRDSAKEENGKTKRIIEGKHQSRNVNSFINGEGMLRVTYKEALGEVLKNENKVSKLLKCSNLKRGELMDIYNGSVPPKLRPKLPMICAAIQYTQHDLGS